MQCTHADSAGAHRSPRAGREAWNRSEQETSEKQVSLKAVRQGGDAYKLLKLTTYPLMSIERKIHSIDACKQQESCEPV